MRINKVLIIKIFKHIWLLIAFSLLVCIISSSIITKRNLVYNLDFNNVLTKDIYGFYPEVRTMFLQDSKELEDNRADVY